MKQLNHYVKKLEFTLGDEDAMEALKAMEDKDLNELGLFRQGESGFTLGRILNHHEFEGEGLPEPNETALFNQTFHISLDVRLSVDENATVELGIAESGTGRHYKYPLGGLSETQVLKFITDSDYQLLLGRAAREAIYHTVWASYRRQDESLESKKEAYKKLVKNCEIYFKELLRLRRYKAIVEKEEKGIKITKSVPINSGTHPQTEAEIEKEKLEFTKAVFRALDRIQAEGGKMTQIDVGMVVFEKELDVKETIEIPSKMKRALGKYKLNFKKLLKEHKELKNGG